jgi:hypothetical protein
MDVVGRKKMRFGLQRCCLGDTGLSGTISIKIDFANSQFYGTGSFMTMFTK